MSLAFLIDVQESFFLGSMEYQWFLGRLTMHVVSWTSWSNWWKILCGVVLENANFGDMHGNSSLTHVFCAAAKRLILLHPRERKSPTEDFKDLHGIRGNRNPDSVGSVTKNSYNAFNVGDMIASWNLESCWLSGTLNAGLLLYLRLR